MKKQKVIRVFQLSSVVVITLFLAGILAPSLMGFTRSANHRMFPSSLHTIKIAGIAVRYKLPKILAALLGTLFGAVIALVTASRTATKKNTGSPAAGDGGSSRLGGFEPPGSVQWLGGLLALLRLEA
jgi:hypothetical protein